ncbi:hypothetical protein EUTSA_v10028012mg [Eutrema salsugineum]|uniref:Uncharacterized protein n=1 Tax=Eutrema salsugineum TaxID=72664 RepID=V4NL90_EUTSA|nr:hypothetical protein EUTSA_v10028012mg [Eutrema salsugineum]
MKINGREWRGAESRQVSRGTRAAESLEAKGGRFCLRLEALFLIRLSIVEMMLSPDLKSLTVVPFNPEAVDRGLPS